MERKLAFHLFPASTQPGNPRSRLLFLHHWRTILAVENLPRILFYRHLFLAARARKRYHFGAHLAGIWCAGARTGFLYLDGFLVTCNAIVLARLVLRTLVEPEIRALWGLPALHP